MLNAKHTLPNSFCRWKRFLRFMNKVRSKHCFNEVIFRNMVWFRPSFTKVNLGISLGMTFRHCFTEVKFMNKVKFRYCFTEVKFRNMV